MSAPYPWQAAAWSSLASLAEKDRLPHALLLTGAAGSGKREFAEALSALLLCQAPAGGDACGSCRSCTLFAAGTHPDLLRLEPEDDSTLVRVDQVRSGTEFVGLSAQLGGRKLVLVDPADAMNVAAANALLKTLEEPPAGTVLLLVSAAPQRLPPTVRSRCTRIDLSARPDAALSWLGDREPAAAAAALALAGGAPLAALAYLDSGMLEHRAPLLEGLTGLATDMTRFGSCSALVLDIGLERLGILLPSLLRDLMIVGLGEADAELANPDLLPALQALANTVDLQRLGELLPLLETLLAQKRAASGLREDMLVDELLGFWTETVSARQGAKL